MKQPARQWWRPELALVLGLPLATIIGGVITLRMVRGDLSAEGAHAQVRRTAQVQTTDLAPDLAAARAGLGARLQVDRLRGEVRVAELPTAAQARELELHFVHPMHAGRDLKARLQAREGAWAAPLSPDPNSRWGVVLVEPARGWRLVGTLPRGGNMLDLQPAVPAP